MDASTHHAFSLDQRTPGTFLLQSLLAALIASYLYQLAGAFGDTTLSLGNLIRVVALNIVLFTIVGIYLWNVATEFSRVTTALRIGLAVGPWIILSLGITALSGPMNIEDLAVTICTAIVNGVITGMLVGSRVRPWGFLTFGTIEVSHDHSTYRLTSNSELALAGTMPLRLVAISIFLVFSWLWVYSYVNQCPGGN